MVICAGMLATLYLGYTPGLRTEHRLSYKVGPSTYIEERMLNIHFKQNGGQHVNVYELILVFAFVNMCIET